MINLGDFHDAELVDRRVVAESMGVSRHKIVVHILQILFEAQGTCSGGAIKQPLFNFKLLLHVKTFHTISGEMMAPRIVLHGIKLMK